MRDRARREGRSSRDCEASGPWGLQVLACGPERSPLTQRREILAGASLSLSLSLGVTLSLSCLSQPTPSQMPGSQCQGHRSSPEYSPWMPMSEPVDGMDGDQRMGFGKCE